MAKPAVLPEISAERMRALRHAREVTTGLRWRGLPVPRVYRRMTAELEQRIAAERHPA